jgi:hypothetical protein
LLLEKLSALYAKQRHRCTLTLTGAACTTLLWYSCTAPSCQPV